MFRNQIQSFARASGWPVADYGETHFSLTPSIVQQLREMPYMERWQSSLDSQWYHVLLEDHSFLTFSISEGSSSYSYIQCPLNVPTFREFLADMGLPLNSSNRREYYLDYEMVVSTASQRDNLTPIRYDYDENGYRRGVHPVSHIHVGLDNNVRLAFAKRLSPLSFVFFVMRQMYPRCWERLLEHQEGARLPVVARRGCVELSIDKWSDHDQIELHLV